MRVREEEDLTKTRLNSLTTEPIAQTSNEASAGSEKRRGRDREAAVALANTQGFVDEFINATIKKGGKGDGKDRASDLQNPQCSVLLDNVRLALSALNGF